MAEARVPASRVELQVAGAAVQDAGKGVARLSSEALDRLGLRGGEVVEITGKRRTAAIALPPFPEDAGLTIVRLDGLERLNAGVGIRDTVTVARADVRPARSVVLAPAQENVRLAGPGEGLKRTLFQRALLPGMIVSTSVYRRLPG